MKPSKAAEEAVVEENVSSGTKVDLLGDYRSALGDLSAAVEKAQTLRSIESGIAASSARLEADKEALLTLAAEAEDINTQVDVEELTQVSAKLEILRRKLSEVTRRAQESEAESKDVLARVSAQLMVLWRAFTAFVFDTEKSKLTAQMVGTPGQLAVEQITMCLRPVQDARRLEPVGTDVTSVLSAATALLEACNAATAFVAPAYVLVGATVAPGANVAPPEEELVGPWLTDDGTEIAALQKQFASENPAGTLPQLHEWLRIKARHLYKTRAQINAMNNLLRELPTGVYETRAPMEGDTFVPTR